LWRKAILSSGPIVWSYRTMGISPAQTSRSSHVSQNATLGRRSRYIVPCGKYCIYIYIWHYSAVFWVVHEALQYSFSFCLVCRGLLQSSNHVLLGQVPFVMEWNKHNGTHHTGGLGTLRDESRGWSLQGTCPNLQDRSKATWTKVDINYGLYILLFWWE